MKLTIILLTAAFLNVNARGVAQNISYSGRNVSLKTIFSSVERQTGYVFFFDKETLDGTTPVTIEAKDMPLNDFLKSVFKDQPVRFSFQGKTIFLSHVTSNVIIITQSDEMPSGIDVIAPPTPIRIRVIGIDGSPLAGASVTIKNSRHSGVTGADGTFSINVAEGDVVLVSFVGYESFSVRVTNSLLSSAGTGNVVLSSDKKLDRATADAVASCASCSGLNVVLKRAVSKLDELQVVAYGTTSQRLSTGNVSTVSAKEIERQPVTNPLLALEGRVPGLFVNQTNGVAGGGIKVLVQGQNSISSGNSPFYVIDGVPYSAELSPVSNGGSILGQSGGGWNPGLGYAMINYQDNVTGNPLNFINPLDIESITVLKDAEATSIYGSKAANGAILITTKKGKLGPTHVDINVQNGWGRPSRLVQVLNTKQYLEIRREAMKNDGVTPGPNDYDLNGDWDTTRYTDWKKELINNAAQYTTLSASVSGGNANVQGTIGATYHKETSVFIGNFANSYGNVHFSVTTATTNRKFSAQLTGSFMVNSNKLPYTDLTELALRLPPNMPSLTNPDGSINWGTNSKGVSTMNYLNVLADYQNHYDNKTDNLTSNALLTYSPVDGLSIKSSFGYNVQHNDEISMYPMSGIAPENRANSSRFAQYANSISGTWSIEPQMTYEHALGIGKVDALLGASFRQTSSRGISFNGSGYSSDALMESITAATTITAGGQSQAVYRYSAIFGRLNYNIRDKYIVEGTVRRDGSSRFGSANQLHTFSSAGVAWIFTNENFFKRKLDWMSFGKLKVSYGTSGNDQIGDYNYISLYSSWVPGVPYQGSAGLQPNGLANPHLQWEEVKKTNIGMDLGFFKDRILINGNFYLNRSSNQLLSKGVASITGFWNLPVNAPATIQNYGWEFTVNTTNIKSKHFQWTSSINMTIPESKVVSFGPSDYVYGTAFGPYLGKPISVTRMYKFGGVDPQTGYYQMINKKGQATSFPVYPDDVDVYVDLAPKYYGGIDNQLTYKTLTLDFLFQYTRRFAQNAKYRYAAYAGGKFNLPIWYYSRWQKPGDITTIQRVTTQQGAYPYDDFGAGVSDATLSDGSYMRLKNVSLYWSLPTEWIKGMGIQSISFYAQAQNLLTFTRYPGTDPESASYDKLPPLKVWTFGLKAQL